MSIDKISTLGNFNIGQIEKNEKSTISGNGSIFDTFLEASSKMYSETNALQKQAESSQIAFATGKTDNVLDVMLSQEKAITSLNYTVQITNKVIEAYKELMQVQL